MTYDLVNRLCISYKVGGGGGGGGVNKSLDYTVGYDIINLWTYYTRVMIGKKCPQFRKFFYQIW